MRYPLPGGHQVLLAGSGQAWLWLAFGVLALALILVLYRYERMLISRRSGLTLLGLRLLAAAALVSLLFEPIVTRSYREELRGRVIVGIDLSESMETVDTDRPASESRRLARALSLSPAEPPEILTRREIARRLLASPAVAQIAAEHALEASGFARGLVPGTPADLAKLMGQPAQTGSSASSLTDWSQVLSLAVRDSEQAPVTGVVLLTDGQHNAPGELSAIADKLAARGVPVYPVLIGSTKAPRDVAIAAVKAPGVVYKGDSASVAVTLKLDGFAGLEIPVTLERPGAAPMRQTVHAPSDGSRPVVSFRVLLDTAGPQPLTVSVAPPPGDARADNDRRSVTVQVADDKARVLLVESEPRWEFRYLRNALTRDPRVEVDAVVFHQPELAATASTTYRAALPARVDATGPGSPPDPLGAFDAIVLGDVAPSDMPATDWARLEAYVAERGGTLIMSAGPRSSPLLRTHETLRKLLPILDPRPVPVDPASINPAHAGLPPGVGIAPAAAADLEAWPMLQFAADPSQSRAIWAALPHLPWVVAGKTKPGASVLASLPGAGRTDDRVAVIAAQAYGLGKVFWVGTDGTWRWRFQVGDAYHHRFWGQVVRWAASDKLTAGNRLVRFGPLRPQVSEGDGARIQARIAEGVPGVSPDLLVAARVFKAGGADENASKSPEPRGEAIAVVPLRALASQPRTFEGMAPALPPGAYVVRLDVPQMASALEIDRMSDVPQASLHVTERDSPERIELAVRRDLADRLATTTGGRVLSDYEAARLPALLHGRSLESVRTEETTLWDKPGPLILFFALLTCEWVLRKRVGLP